MKIVIFHRLWLKSLGNFALKFSHSKQYKRICVSLLGRNKPGQILAGWFPTCTMTVTFQTPLGVKHGCTLVCCAPSIAGVTDDICSHMVTQQPAACQVGHISCVECFTFTNSPNPHSSMIQSCCYPRACMGKSWEVVLDSPVQSPNCLCL